MENVIREVVAMIMMAVILGLAKKFVDFEFAVLLGMAILYATHFKHMSWKH